jgi:hypothetical protein
VKGSRPSAVAWRWLPVLPLLFGAGCGGPQSLGDAGAQCFRDDDCAPGLICVAPPTDAVNRVCSSDPTPLISNVEGPPVAMGGDAALAGSAGAATAGGGAAAVAGGGAGGTMPAAGAGTGGTATAGTDTGGTDMGGTDTGGTDTGGTDTGGSAGSNAGTDPGGTGGAMAGTAGTVSDGGAQ